MNAELKRKRASASSLFLMELVVAILFFTLAASVCITIFVQAHIQSERAKALNHALNICSDTAELVRTSNSIEEVSQQIGRVYEYAELSQESNPYEISIYFNDNYLPTAKSTLAQVETVQLTETDDMLNADLTFRNVNGDEVYRLSVNHAKQPSP